MGLFSKQVFFCNACGKKLEVEYAALCGRDWKVCTTDCHREMEYRRAKSILGET